jgi:hypothetical protein
MRGLKYDESLLYSVVFFIPRSPKLQTRSVMVRTTESRHVWYLLFRLKASAE